MTIEVNKLEKDTYKQTAVYGKSEVILPGLFPELDIDLSNVFKG